MLKSLKGFLVIIILGAAIYMILHYVDSGGGSDLPEKIKSINAVGDLTTEKNMKTLQQEIVAYLAEHGTPPESLDKLFVSKNWLRGLADVWGTPIGYERISDISFVLRSAGKDKTFHTPDDIVLEY
jgi:hypothetical protein